MGQRGRRSKAQIQAAQEALARVADVPAPGPAPADGRSRMDITLKTDGTPVLFTWYKGHRFEGWLSQDAFTRMEEDGVLNWDAVGNPVINESKIKPPTAGRGPAWIGEGI